LESDRKSKCGESSASSAMELGLKWAGFTTGEGFVDDGRVETGRVGSGFLWRV
jgi:hypothetical protein